MKLRIHNCTDCLYCLQTFHRKTEGLIKELERIDFNYIGYCIPLKRLFKETIPKKECPKRGEDIYLNQINREIDTEDGKVEVL